MWHFALKFKIVVIFILYWTTAFNQTAEDSYNLDLSIPTSPGFSILDKAPECINRPSDANALGISIINSFTENYGLPSSYAIEIAPYWYSSKFKSYDSYIGLKLVKNSTDFASKKKFSYSANESSLFIGSTSMNNYGKLNTGKREYNSLVYDSSSFAYNSKMNSNDYDTLNQELNYVQQNIWSKIKQSTISLAYINTIQKDGYDLMNNVAFGFRVPLINIKSKYTISDYLDGRNGYLAILNNEIFRNTTIQSCAAHSYYLGTIGLTQDDMAKIENIKTSITSFESMNLSINSTKEDALARILFLSELPIQSPEYAAYYSSFLFEFMMDSAEFQSSNEVLFKIINDLKTNQILQEALILEETTLYSALKMKEALDDLPLFRMEIAGAGSLFFSENSFSAIQHGRSGLWLSLELNKKGSARLSDKFKYISLLGIGRFFADGTQLDTQRKFKTNLMFDTGAKLIFEFKKFNFGAEGVLRYNVSNQSSSYRVSSNLGIAISEKVNLSASFGKNFGDNNNVISVMGLDWSFLQNLLNVKDNFKRN
jgi:hypothetical protein